MEYEYLYERHSIPRRFDQFSDIGYGFVDDIDRIRKDNLISIPVSTQKVKHTKIGSSVYEIIKECFSMYLDDEKFAAWLKRGRHILSVKMQGGEYIQRTVSFARETISEGIAIK